LQQKIQTPVYKLITFTIFSNKKCSINSSVIKNKTFANFYR